MQPVLLLYQTQVAIRQAQGPIAQKVLGLGLQAIPRRCMAHRGNIGLGGGLKYTHYYCTTFVLTDSIFPISKGEDAVRFSVGHRGRVPV